MTTTLPLTDELLGQPCHSCITGPSVFLVVFDDGAFFRLCASCAYVAPLVK